MTTASPPPPVDTQTQGASTRPYLIRALHEWCTDQGFTPYLAVAVDDQVRVPQEYVKNGEIVLNVGFDATQGLKLGNEWIEFRARFGGVARDIHVPVGHVIAIYARENGQGMAFPAPMAKAPAPVTVLSSVPSSLERDPLAAVPTGAAPSAVASLRLAPVGASGTAGESATNNPASTADPTQQPPSEPPAGGAPGGARPSLKRIK